jgi:hypothetical protein
MALRLGCSSGAFYPELLTEQVPVTAAALGFSDLELLLQTPGEYAPAFFAEAKRAADAAGCRVRSLHTFQPLHPIATPYDRRRHEAVALFQQAIDGAMSLGARAIVWHGLTRAEAASPEHWSDFLRATETLAVRCSEAGVTLALENVSWCALASVRDVLAFAARIPELGPPGSIGFTFDPFQASEASANPFMILAAMEPATGYDGPMMIECSLLAEDAAERIRTRLDPLIAAAGTDGDPCAGPPPAGVLEGIRLFNARKYYEAHEELEHEWHAERRPIRRLYQGILQIGVGFHHARGGNHAGAFLLLTDGIAKTSDFLPACQGLDLTRLVLESQAVLDELVALGPEGLFTFDWDQLPRVHSLEASIRSESPPE